MPDEVDALITFYEGWKEDGVGPDGLPLFREVVMITKAKPPLLLLNSEATDDDIEQFAGAFKQFQKLRDGRDLSKVKGYPLVLWPVVGAAERQSLFVRDIVTVEQLAQLTFKKADDVPAPLRELAVRARDFLKLQKESGRYEVLVAELTAERDAVVEQLREANQTISAQNALIEKMRMQPAAA